MTSAKVGADDRAAFPHADENAIVAVELGPRPVSLCLSLSGVFPQDEYPEEVSTDEDDDMFASRKRMKRGGRVEEDEEGAPASKKSKGI